MGVAHWILNPARLPIPPLSQFVMCQLVGTTGGPALRRPWPLADQLPGRLFYHRQPVTKGGLGKSVDGKTLDGWIPTGAKGAWTVKDGMLVGRGNTAHLFAKTRYTARPTTATKTLVDGYFKRRTRWRPGV